MRERYTYCCTLVGISVPSIPLLPGKASLFTYVLVRVDSTDQATLAPELVVHFQTARVISSFGLLVDVFGLEHVPAR